MSFKYVENNGVSKKYTDPSLKLTVTALSAKIKVRIMQKKKVFLDTYYCCIDVCVALGGLTEGAAVAHWLEQVS